MMNRKISASFAGALASALLLSACGAGPSEASGAPLATPSGEGMRHPQSGLPLVDLAVASGHKLHRFRVEVARSSAEQAQGLMFRTKLGADEGMLFPMQPPRGTAFWMKNTVIPLDIIFVGPDGRITNIAANAVPYSLEPLESAGLASAVIELVGGRAAELGIAPGDRVEW